MEKGINLADRLLDLSSIHLVTSILSLGITVKLDFNYNHKNKEEISFESRHRRLCVTCKFENQLLRRVSCVQTVSMKLLENFLETA